MMAKHSREQGQALVEFALLFMLLMLLVMGVLAFGTILTSQIGLTSIVKDAARLANLRSLHVEYCTRAPTDHYNSPIYNAIANNMGNLSKNNIESIIIFQAADDGSITADRQDVLDKNGNLLTSSFRNLYRCSDTISIGVEVRYNQAVPVPIVNLITGDPMVLRARAIFHIE